MNNKVVNKQITLKSIIDVANYMEDYKEDYIRKFELDENKNKNIPFGEKVLEYENGNAEIRYTIEFHNGKTITETDYNWFIGNINEPEIIKGIIIDLSVSYFSNASRNSNNEYNRINAYIEFQDCGMNLKYSDASVSVETTNKENEAHNIYSEIMNILGYSNGEILKCCKREISTYKDFIWIYDDGNIDDIKFFEKKYKCRQVIQFTKENKYINTFSSITKAAQMTGVERRKIGECCSGKCETAGGFIWKYA